MSYEAAMKHYPKDKPKPTREEWEASLKRLEGLDLPIPDFRPPIPPAVHFLEAKAEAEERRHQEMLAAILNSKHVEAEAHSEPEDPTDARIMDLLHEDISLTDNQIAQRIGLSRQTVNTRRNALKKAGYKVR